MTEDGVRAGDSPAVPEPDGSHESDADSSVAPPASEPPAAEPPAAPPAGEPPVAPDERVVSPPTDWLAPPPLPTDWLAPVAPARPPVAPRAVVPPVVVPLPVASPVVAPLAVAPTPVAPPPPQAPIAQEPPEDESLADDSLGDDLLDDEPEESTRPKPSLSERLKRTSPALVILTLAAVGSSGFLAYELSTRVAPIAVLSSAAMVTGICYLLISIVCAVTTYRAASDGRTRLAFLLAFIGGIAAIVAAMSFAGGLLLVLALGF